METMLTAYWISDVATAIVDLTTDQSS